MAAQPGRVLVVGPLAEVHEEIARLAATAGVPAQAIDPAELTDLSWSAPSLVIVDADCAEQVGSAALSRRPGVVMVTAGLPTAELWSAAVRIGVERVVELPAGHIWLGERLADVAAGPGPLGVLLAVIGGSGGAGASTLAAALATSAARSGQQPVLLGADPWDGGIDIALGAEGVPGPRWPDLAGVSGRLSSAAILDGLPEAHGVRFLSSSRSQPAQVPLAALAAVVAAARRTGGPVIVDLPRAAGETARWLGGLVDLGLVVCPATVPGALASRVLVAELGWNAGSCGIVRRSGLGRDIDDAALSGAVGLPVVARVREDVRVLTQRRSGQLQGVGRRSHLARSCADLLRLAAERQGLAA